MIDYEYEQIEIAYNARDDRDFRMLAGSAQQLRRGFTVAEVAASRANAKERRLLERTVDQLEANKQYAARCLETDRQLAEKRRQLLLRRCANDQRRSHLDPEERAELVALDRAGRFRLPASACACSIGGGFSSARLIRAAQRRLGRSPGQLPGYLTARRAAAVPRLSAPADSAEACEHADEDDGIVEDEEDDKDPTAALRTGPDFLPLLPPRVGGVASTVTGWSTHRTAARPSNMAPFAGAATPLWRGFSAPESARLTLTEAGRHQRVAEERDRMERLADGNMRRFIESLERLSLRAGAG